MQLRVARPTRHLTAARRFYGEALGLPVVASFEGHDGYSGVVFGLPDAARQLELVWHEAAASRLQAAGLEPREAANPYWAKNGAACFVDPDGYWLVLSPEAWPEDR
jgi:catechol 2,3-dioxygenase-like lactoylglutathione lyase family enzyme